MNQVESKIIKVLFFPFTLMSVFYIFSIIWKFLNLYNYKGTNLFIVNSECDPTEREPSILVTIFLIIICIYINNKIVSLFN